MVSEERFIVSESAVRPTGQPDECFYCHRKIGQEHGPECVLVMRNAVVRVVIEYPVVIPAHWGAKDFESHRNEGTWCRSNVIAELAAASRKLGCLCKCSRFKLLSIHEQRFVAEG